MKLLVEEIVDFKTITEDIDGNPGKKRYYMEGIFMQAEKVNRNGRKYPLSVMEKDLSRYIKEEVNTNRAYGTYGHLDTPKVPEGKESHRIRELRLEGNDVYGKASVLNNINGEMIKSIIDDGGAFGMSSKALGSVKSIGGINEVQNDFNIRSVDCVLQPSGIDCWTQGIFESKEWVFIGGEWKERIVEYEKEQSELSNTNLTLESVELLVNDRLKNIEQLILEQVKPKINQIYREHKYDKSAIENASLLIFNDFIRKI